MYLQDFLCRILLVVVFGVICLDVKAEDNKYSLTLEAQQVYKTSKDKVQIKQTGVVKKEKQDSKKGKNLFFLYLLSILASK